MIVDLIIVAILALSIFLGYRKGLVKLAVKLCAVVIALVVTLILYQPISNIIINNTGLDEKLQDIILEKSNEVVEQSVSTVNDTPAQELTGQMAEEAKNELLPSAARDLAVNIIRIGVMLVLYIVIKIAISIIAALADKIADLPILHQFNKAGGIIYGAIRGIIVIYVILMLIGVVGEINPENRAYKEVESSHLGKVMYENNVFELFTK